MPMPTIPRRAVTATAAAVLLFLAAAAAAVAWHHHRAEQDRLAAQAAAQAAADQQAAKDFQAWLAANLALARAAREAGQRLEDEGNRRTLHLQRRAAAGDQAAAAALDTFRRAGIDVDAEAQAARLLESADAPPPNP